MRGVTEKDVSSERLAAGVRDALAGKVKMGMTTSARSTCWWSGARAGG